MFPFTTNNIFTMFPWNIIGCMLPFDNHRVCLPYCVWSIFSSGLRSFQSRCIDGESALSEARRHARKKDYMESRFSINNDIKYVDARYPEVGLVLID